MTGEIAGLDLIEIFNSLSAIPLSHQEESAALKSITDLGRQVLGSHACTLTFVDLEAKTLSQKACSSVNENFEKQMKTKPIPLGSLKEKGVFLDYDLIRQGELVERYGLKQSGQGIANPGTAQKYNLSAILAYPLEWEERLVGYFNHFSDRDSPLVNGKRSYFKYLHDKQCLLSTDSNIIERSNAR